MVHDIKASSQTCPTNTSRDCMVHDIKASIQTCYEVNQKHAEYEDVMML